ncbi:MAG: hypothetical protein WC470_03655 [Candidatus Paceibacterota bacterium]
MDIKKNLSLVVAILIPVLMVLFLVAVIYVPRIYNHPQYNFVFVSGGNYNEEYIIQNGKLIARLNTDNIVPIDKAAPAVPPQKFLARLFVYDIKQDKSAEVTLEQAQAMNFYPDVKSPDGYEIINGSSSYGFSLFGGYSQDFSTLFITGHGLNKKLNTPVLASNRYDINLRFVGWVNSAN